MILDDKVGFGKNLNCSVQIMEDILVFEALTSPVTPVAPRTILKPTGSTLPWRKFNDYYIEGNLIGRGTYASVYRCLRRSDLSEFAVKIINKKRLTAPELAGLTNEIKILRNISHPNVIKLIDVFHERRTVFMVIELCDSQDLFDHIYASKGTHLTESKTAEIAYTICDAMQSLHEMGVVHRDLKPENILFGLDNKLKITDFGLAHYTQLAPPLSHEDVLMDACCGTPYYVAPEVLSGNLYDDKCDMWSLGVMIYVMLVGYQPFAICDGSVEIVYAAISAARYNFKHTKWKKISKEAKHLVQSLLELDANKRYSPQDVMRHPWIRKHVHKTL
eukprot:147608_1